jgi:hypothetical protein
MRAMNLLHNFVVLSSLRHSFVLPTMFASLHSTLNTFFAEFDATCVNVLHWLAYYAIRFIVLTRYMLYAAFYALYVICFIVLSRYGI